MNLIQKIIQETCPHCVHWRLALAALHHGHPAWSQQVHQIQSSGDIFSDFELVSRSHDHPSVRKAQGKRKNIDSVSKSLKHWFCVCLRHSASAPPVLQNAFCKIIAELAVMHFLWAILQSACETIRIYYMSVYIIQSLTNIEKHWQMLACKALAALLSSSHVPPPCENTGSSTPKLPAAVVAQM